MVVALPKRLVNKQTNKHTKKLFVSVSKIHDDIGYLLDHSVSSSPPKTWVTLHQSYGQSFYQVSIDAVNKQTNKQKINKQTYKKKKYLYQSLKAMMTLALSSRLFCIIIFQKA